MLNENELIHTVVVTGCVSCLCPRHKVAISNTVPEHILVTLGRGSGRRKSKRWRTHGVKPSHFYETLAGEVIGRPD